MIRARRRAFAAGIAFAALPGLAAAQDPVVERHVLALDLGRVTPFHRTYDIIVHRRDSSTTIGSRDVTLQEHALGGVTGWLLAERRTGSVAAAESLFLARDLRPVSWSARLGPARLAVVFVGDTILGATTIGPTKQNLLLVGRPDLLVSAAMVELILGLSPLGPQWSDSAAVLSVGVAERDVRPAELAVLGEEEIPVDSLTYRRARVVTLRTDAMSALYWLDPETGVVWRMQQVLPAHVGMLLEYRLRPVPNASLQ